MRAAFAIAALAGSAIAAPSYGRPHSGKEHKNVHVIVETVVHTVYVTEGLEVAKPTPTPSPEPVYTPEPVYSAPAEPTTIVYEEPAQPSSKIEEPAYPAPTPEAPAPTPEAPAPTSEAPAPTSEAPAPTPTPEAPAPPSNNNGYMAVVDEYRQKLGLKALSWDSKLESNAKDVVAAGNGEMVHKLNPGTFGQVLAPGKPEEFERVFVGGWLCEIPSLPGLENVCGKMSQGWDYRGQTGHADILTSDNYSKIACAVDKDIWCCDLA